MPKSGKRLAGQDEQKPRTAGKTVASVIARIVSLFFYAAILAIVVMVFLLGDQGGRPRILFGYSAYSVLSGSMQSEIPQGSLVLVQSVDPDTIQIGDDITYVNANRDLVTHRVISIAENYEQSGMRGFVTKGLENPYPDRDAVFADNVVGKVVFHHLLLGNILAYIRDRVWLVVLMAVLLILFFTALRWLIRSSRSSSAPQETAETEPETDDPPAEAASRETKPRETDTKKQP